MNTHRGFTLIELMIVVAIIAILAAIAISQYQDYIIRSEVSEGTALADGSKTALAEFWNNYGRWGAANSSFGLAAPASIVGKYVTSVNVAGGVIDVTYGGSEVAVPLSGQHLMFSPTPNEGSISWTCNHSAALKVKWLPASCRT